jgi:hypothetical protein
MDNLARSMERSKELVEGFEETTIKTGLSTKELAGTAKSLAPAIGAASGTTAQLAELTKKVALYTKLTGQGTEEGAMGLRMFLQYGMARNNQLLADLGLHGQIYAKMTAQQRLQLVESRLGKAGFSEATLRQYETFNDKVARVKGILEIIAERAGKPLFDKAADAAGRLADWLDKNQDKVKAIETEVVDKLAAGFDKIVSLAKFLSDHLDAVENTVKVIAATWATMKIMGTTAKIIGAFGEGGASMAASFAGAIPYVAIGAGIATALGLAIKGGVFDSILGIKHGGEVKATTTTADFKKQLDRVDAYLDAAIEDPRFKNAVRYSRTVKHLSAEAAAQDVINQLAETAGKHSLGAEKGLMIGADDVKAFWQRRNIAPAVPGAPKGEADRGRGDINQNFYNAKFDIMQQFAPGFDPDRIAVAFTSDLANLADKRHQSALAPHNSH